MLQPGRGYNFTTSGGVGTLNVEPDWQLPADPDQFQVSVFKGAEAWGVQCRKGFVRTKSHTFPSAWAQDCFQYEVQKFYGYPSGSKTTGDAPTVADSSLVDLGGYISINPASVEGGSDSWGVYIIGCALDDGTTIFIPYLAIMAEGSDADTKSEPFLGNGQIKHYQLYDQTLVDVTTPTGTTTLTIFNFGGQAIYNYNCQKWKIADLDWDGDTFVVTQAHLGPLSLPSPVSFEGFQYVDPASPPAWYPTPYYDTELADWHGSWSGYTKDSTGATVQT
jgi:hypothetical protein